MIDKYKKFGLVLSITGLLLSLLGIGLGLFFTIDMYQIMTDSDGKDIGEALGAVFLIIPLLMFAFISLMMVLFTVYHIFFLISVVRACKGGKLKVLRKLGMAVSILNIVFCSMIILFLIIAKADGIILYLIPIIYIANSICQIVFYNAYKKVFSLGKVE